MEERMITAHEAARLIDVAPSTIIKHINLGTIYAEKREKIVPVYFIRESDLIHIRKFYLEGTKKRGRRPKWITPKQA